MRGLALLWPCIVLTVSAHAGTVTVNPEGPLVRKLSEYNLFSDLAAHAPNAGVIPYDLNSTLFTDYAEKFRFIWVPEGSAAQYDAEEVFEFPVGTIITKTFSYPRDASDPDGGMRHMETRVLLHRASGWTALPYVWNEEQTEATLAVAGARLNADVTKADGSVEAINYIVPNMNQCKSCHENQGNIRPIGPKARHLNKDYAYPDGTMNQLAKLMDAGYLEGAPADLESAPRLPAWDQPEHAGLESRARAYLDINCAHCHNPKGPAYTSGLDLSWRQTDPRSVGVYKPPVAAGRGSGGHLYSIVPGEPEKSILVHRMSTDDPGSMMPQLGRSLMHEEGVKLISDWVASLAPEDFEAHRETGDGGDEAP